MSIWTHCKLQVLLVYFYIHQTVPQLCQFFSVHHSIPFYVRVYLLIFFCFVSCDVLRAAFSLLFGGYPIASHFNGHWSKQIIFKYTRNLRSEYQILDSISVSNGKWLYWWRRWIIYGQMRISYLSYLILIFKLLLNCCAQSMEHFLLPMTANLYDRRSFNTWKV